MTYNVFGGTLKVLYLSTYLSQDTQDSAQGYGVGLRVP